MGKGAYHDQKPSWKPQYGPNAAVTQATYPESSGKAVASSAVTKASGMDHSNGRHRKPISANSGPPALTASCEQRPKGLRHVATSYRVTVRGREGSAAARTSTCDLIMWAWTVCVVKADRMYGHPATT